MTQPDQFASGRTAMIRSASHSHFGSLPTEHETENLSTTSPIPASIAEQPAAFDDLACSWPPPRFSATFPETRKKKVGQSSRGGPFIPGPEDDDYGRRLKSRLAVQRLAPTASPKAKECALLLRTASSHSVTPPSPTSTETSGVNLFPDSPDSKHGPQLDTTSEQPQLAEETPYQFPGFPSERRLERTAGGLRKSLAVQREAFDLNAPASLTKEADLNSSKAPLKPPSFEQRLSYSRSIKFGQNLPSKQQSGTSQPLEPGLQSLPIGSPFQIPSKSSTNHLPPKPFSVPAAGVSKPAIGISKTTADVSTPVADISMSKSGPQPPRIFQGPPGFPGANGGSAPVSDSLPLPPDEYENPPTVGNEYGEPPLLKNKHAGAHKNKLGQQLIRPIHTEEGVMSRLHLISSVNELSNRGTDRPSGSGARSRLSLDEDRSGLREGDDDSERGGQVLWKTTSLPQGYLDRYLVPNDEEVEYEREEAGIGKNSPRPSPLSWTPSSSNGAPSTPHKRPRLILHLDVNKTILIKDTAQDAGSDSMVNVLLSECAWGRLLPGPCWIPVGRLATDKPANDPELMTYRSYLDTFYLPLQRGFGPEIDRANEDVKHRRQALKRCFTAPGEPGAMFRGVYDKLLEELRVAEPMQAEMRACGLGNGKELVLLPSFFELLKHLKNSGRDFAIVFRTFGSDVMDVSKELNLFCEGRHPYHPGVLMNGQDGPTDLRLHTLDSYGCFYRQGFGSEGTLLAFGPPEEALRKHIARLDELEKCAECHWSFRAIYNAIIARCIEGGNIALAFRDYYPWWKAHQERARTGKLLLVDKEDVNTRQVFFDDNIGTGSPHIVDVRDVSTGEPVPFAEASGKYLVKVEPLHAILDRQYFIRAVHRCEESIEGARDWRGFRDAPRSKNSKWDVARRKLFSIIRLGSGQR